MSPYPILLPLAAYVYGSIPFGFLMARAIKGVDIRSRGSGNIGATNAARVLGFRFFPLIFLLDFSKGFAPALIAGHAAGEATHFSPAPLAVLCALAAILGHVFPVFLRFRGGKAVAAGTGAFIVLAPWPLLIAAGVWCAVFAAFRYVSLASILAALVLGTTVWIPGLNPDPAGAGIFASLFGTAAALMVITLHRANIGRLLSGNEHKIGSGRKLSPDTDREEHIPGPEKH